MTTRTLCLVGAAQLTGREPGEIGEPLDGWERVARAAAEDAGRPDALSYIDSLQVIYCQTWPYDDPVGRLAERIGSTPRHRRYSGIGGTTPQVLLSETAAAMQRGELDSALIVSGEALATMKAAKRAGERLPWSFRESGHQFPWDPPHASEMNHQVFQAWETFPLWDTARRARHAHALDDDAREAAELFAAMSHVAAANPHAWRPEALTADQVGTPGPDNRYVGWPYTKNEVAVMDVDMFAAVLVMTDEHADAVGIPEDRRVWLASSAYAEDPAAIAERDDLSRSAAMSVTGSAALDGAGLSLDDLGCFELYSCFPSSVRLACDALGLALNDPRGLTVTGGLPYAGGPGSGYVLHGIASMAERLRTAGGAGLITGVGMNLQKHVAAVWSSRPPAATAVADSGRLQAAVESSQPRRTVLTNYDGAATVAAYTVAHGRDGSPQQGLVILDTPSDRVIARVHDVSLLNDAEGRELVGEQVTVITDGVTNTAAW